MFGALDFDVKIGRVCVKHTVQLWNFCTDSEFAVGQKGTKENLDLVGWSQELPDAYHFMEARTHT
jgi:hypothetical protein